MSSVPESTKSIHIASTAEQILACFPVISQLRPHLIDSVAFVAQVRRQQQEQFELAYVADHGTPVAVAGYRFGECLYAGKYMYVDDLVTDAAQRSAGHGQALFEWLMRRAAERGCARLTLDSAVHRFDAHRFYLRNRLAITAHHFEVIVSRAGGGPGLP